MQKNTAGKWIVFAFDRTTNIPKTGDAANITANLRIDGGAANAVDDTNPTELEDGFYIFDITAAEANGDNIVISPESTTANIQVIGVPGAVWTTPPAFNALTVAAIQAEMEENGASILDSISDKLPTNYIMGSSVQTDKDDDIDAILVDTGTTLDGKLDTLLSRISATVATALTKIADVAIAGTETAGSLLRLFYDRVTGAVALDSTVAKEATLTAVDGKIDIIDTILDTLKALFIIREATVVDTSPSVTKFKTSLTEDTADYWNNGVLQWKVGAANNGLLRAFKDYVVTGKEVTLNTALPIVPANGDGFYIISARAFKLAGVDPIDIWNMLENLITVADSIGLKVKTNLDAKVSLTALDSTVAKQATLDNVTYGLSALKTLIDAIDTSTELQARFIEIKGAGWTTETLKAIKDVIDTINLETDDLVAIKAQTDKMVFSGSDIKATLDGEEVTPTVASKTGYALSTTSEDAIVTKVWAATTRTLSSFGILIADIWAYATRKLTSRNIAVGEDIAKEQTLLSAVVTGSVLIPGVTDDGEIITLYYGNSYDGLQFTLGSAWSAYLGAGNEVYIAAKKRYSDATMLFNVKGTIVDQPTGVVSFNLTPANTTMTPSDNYVLEVQVIKPDGTIVKSAIIRRLELKDRVRK